MSRIQQMSLSDVEQLIDMAAEEGWNPGLDDAATFHRADPEGFFMACDGDDMAAGISVVRQGNAHGFLGLYICHPRYRGQGYGWAVWQAGMDFLSGRTVGLDGVLEQQANYRKSGFELCYRNIRYHGIPDGTALRSRLAVQSLPHGCTCRPPEASDLAAAFALDWQVHGFDRQDMLNHWFLDSESRCTLVCVQGSRLLGVGTIRACRDGHKIGPLMALDADVAAALFAQLLKHADAQDIILDVPEPNAKALELAQTLQLKPVFETARMYRGKAPESRLSMLYGVTSFELG